MIRFKTNDAAGAPAAAKPVAKAAEATIDDQDVNPLAKPTRKKFGKTKPAAEPEDTLL